MLAAKEISEISLFFRFPHFCNIAVSPNYQSKRQDWSTAAMIRCKDQGLVSLHF